MQPLAQRGVEVKLPAPWYDRSPQSGKTKLVEAHPRALLQDDVQVFDVDVNASVVKQQVKRNAVFD
jgi:hypothetical protein